MDTWFEKLRMAADTKEAATLLAQALGESGGAVRAQVFMLDNTRANLLLWGTWGNAAATEAPDAGTSNSLDNSAFNTAPNSANGSTANAATASATNAASASAIGAASAAPQKRVPAWNLQDPLCLALQQGKTIEAPLLAGMPPYPSLGLSGEYLPQEALLAAHPLQAWQNMSIGGVLLTFPPRHGAIFTPQAHAATPRQTGFTEGLKALCAYGALLLAALDRQRQDVAHINSLHDDISRLECDKASHEASGKTFLVGHSPVMAKIREQIAQIARHKVSVLITGETGTGKELAASAIHELSPRSKAPFVKINCGAMPAQLLESELFGHKKGAFSGAHADNPGLLRSAEGGTVLLDEIGEMPPELQVKLLRVLQDHEVRPVGDLRSFPVDIRIIAATNLNIKEAMEGGLFRKDLYYRLATCHIHLPALSERREDIPELALYFLARFLARHNAPSNQTGHVQINHAQMALLCTRDYPGNVRELAALVERAVVSIKSGPNTALPLFAEGEAQANAMKLHEHMAMYERAIINSAMLCNNGNVSRAARSLGLPRTTLLRKIQKNAAG